MDHALSLPSPLRRTLHDRSFTRDKLAKITTAKVEHETGQLNTPLERPEACLSGQSIPYRVPLPFDSLRDVSPCYFSLPFPIFTTYTFFLYPSFSSSRTDIFPSPPPSILKKDEGMGFCQIDSRVALVRSHSFE